MLDKNFDALLDRHLAGQAYLTITENMGPNPQLIAFLNYEQLGDGDTVSFGLESLNIRSQHDEIVSEINADKSLEIAVEGLAEHLRHVADGLKDVGKVVDRHSPYGSTGSVIGKGVGVLGSLISNYADRNEVLVHDYDSFHGISVDFEKAKLMELTLIKMLPDDFTEASWVAFRRESDKQTIEFNKGKLSWFASHETKTTPHITGSGPMIMMRESGWTPGRIEEAKRWWDHSSKELANMAAAYAKDIARIQKWVIEGDRNASPAEKAQAHKVMRHINATIGTNVAVFGVCSRLLHNGGAVVASLERWLEHVNKEAN